MKKKFIFILILLISLNVFSQEYFVGEIEYTNELKFKTKQDSINYVKRYSGYLSIINHKAEKYLIKKDTVLIIEYSKLQPSEQSEQSILIVTKNKFKKIDAISGRIVKKWRDYSPKRFLNFSKYQRIVNKDQIILDRNCKAYVSSYKGIRKIIWLHDEKKISPVKKNTRIFLNNQIILKEIIYYQNGRIIEKTAKKIKSLENNNFKKNIQTNTEVDIKLKYNPIEENQSYDKKSIKKGEQIVNLYYRSIFEDKLSSLYQTTQTSDFTIIEMWGTWCAPCLIANEKIKNLRKKHSIEKLNIISLNTHDRNIKKVKSVIERKQMDWIHGYSTKKIISILNKKGSYPHLIIINKKNKILFIGNPLGNIKEINKIIDEK